MTKSNKQYCVLRKVLLAGSENSSPWPIGYDQIGAACQIGYGYNFLPRNRASDAMLYLTSDKPEAEDMARDLDSLANVKHSVADINSLKFDVWLYDHYNGTSHYQVMNENLHSARLIYLAAVGFAEGMHGGVYWKAHMHVVCPSYRRMYPKLPKNGIDLQNGIFEYDIHNVELIDE